MNASDVNVFSRGSLNLTFDLIRRQEPTLALKLRNLTQLTPLDLPEFDSENKNSHHFVVNLNSHEVRTIVETLMNICEKEVDKSIASGTLILAKALIDDWMALAHQMYEEQNNTRSG